MRPHILIVDDDEFMHILFESKLREQLVDFRLTTAKTADTAMRVIDSLTEDAPDLIILDYLLPFDEVRSKSRSVSDPESLSIIDKILASTAFAEIPIVLISALTPERPKDRLSGVDGAVWYYKEWPLQTLATLAIAILSTRKRLERRRQTIDRTGSQSLRSGQNVTINGPVHGSVSLAGRDFDASHTTSTLVSLRSQIARENAPEQEKRTALERIDSLMNNPLVSAILGGAASVFGS